MEFRILGPLEVVENGRAIQLGGPKQRGLLAILLTRSNEVVSMDRLIDELWRGEPPKTAANTVQFYVSQLRKALGPDRILTRPPGYAISIEPGELDLARFEELADAGGAESLREALSLWRGPALHDFTYETFAQTEIARLEELRLTALERRIEADLELSRHADLVGELEALVSEHPLRERLRAQHILALYRSGRQAQALEAYATMRRAFSEEFGIEPSPALRELEKAVLQQDPALDLIDSAPKPERSILVAVQDENRVDSLLALAEPLARRPVRELILAKVIADQEGLPRAASLLNAHRETLEASGASARSAAFTSSTPGEDVVRLASEQRVDLVLLDGPRSVLDQGFFPAQLEVVLSEAPCDVAVLLEHDAPPAPGPGRPLLVPFGGADHDWAAVEIAAWIAGAQGASLQLLGSAEGKGGRDASRLLASASLLVQRMVGISTEPLLVQRGPAAVVEASTGAGLVVIGLTPRWRSEGLGETRLAVARAARPPTLLVSRGLRPGGLAPEQRLTHFTWSIATPEAPRSRR
jgi:DNA-binding SARP family transcriptional activator